MSITAASLSKLFTLADTSKDNSLSATELADEIDSLPNPQNLSAADMAKQMDTNGDGKVSEDEFVQGVQLNEKVGNALLSAQELTSGKAFLAMLSGDSSGSSSSLASLFGGSDTSSTDSYTSMIQSYIDKYNSTKTSDTTSTSSSSTTQTSA